MDNSLSLENIFDQAEQLLFDVTQKETKSRTFTCFRSVTRNFS